ncbi:hypothetical protein MBLNU13_g03524t1 [Cladosporium sp. NU13]
MASNGRGTFDSGSRPAKPRMPTYADVLKTPKPPRPNVQLKQINESRQPSQKPDSAVQKVFNLPELLGMILAELPLASDRSAMSVSRQFWQALNPDAEDPLYGIKKALGIEFSRSLKSMTYVEKAELERAGGLPPEIHPLRMSWLVNIELDRPSCLLSRRSAFLRIKPFVLHVMGAVMRDGVFVIKLRLNAEDTDARYTEWKGVAALRDGQKRLWSNGDLVSRNWMDVKLLAMPFKVKVTVAVDFRTGMGSPHHPRGPCPAPGCQLGLHGIQYTMKTFEPQKATQGELISFLDIFEKDARDIAASIARRSARPGPGPFGEAYYLGSSVPPPTMPGQYIDEYVTTTSAYVPDSQTVEQMRPRKMRDFTYGSLPGSI